MRPRVVPPPSDAAGGADAEERLVGENVLPVEEPDLTAGQDLTPAAPDGQVHLPHVDLGAEAVVRAGAIGAGTALDLGREAEVDAEIGVAFLTLRIEHGEGRQQAGAEVEALRRRSRSGRRARQSCPRSRSGIRKPRTRSRFQRT